MALVVKYNTLCEILLKNGTLLGQEKAKLVIHHLESTYNCKLDKEEFYKIENFVKLFEKKWKSVCSSVTKFKSKFSDWMDTDMKLSICVLTSGPPSKQYDDLGSKSKKKRLSESLSTMSSEEVCDTFKAMLKKEKQPFDAVKIANILPKASPKRLKRIVKSIPTPTSNEVFTEEEAIALMLQLGLSRDKYITLRKALSKKGVDVLPSYTAIQERKKIIMPSPVEISDKKAKISISALLENTASRIVSDFSTVQLNKVNNCDLQLICKWGCDGLSTLPDYKQASQTSTDYKSVFMASLVPLRIRKYADSDSPSTSYEDVWINETPGSKFFCRPIMFEYTKETTNTTKEFVDSIQAEIECLEPVSIVIGDYCFNMSFDMKLTMIDGKVGNAITETRSNWNCSICGEKRSDFSKISKDRTIKEEVLKFGISPLHARIRFLEFFLHLAYDLKYRSIPENINKTAKNNEELINMRANEKRRIQEEFKRETGLNIDKPLIGHGNTNDGNTARRFFNNFETTSKITGINVELLQKVNIILMAVNSKHRVNPIKFGEYARNISQMLINLYPWKIMTPTVHKLLCHGQIIIEHNILPLGELTEEPQESRNRDFKYAQQFSSRKCSRESQTEDIFNNLLLSSDPTLSSMRKRWICYRSLTFDNIKEYKDLLHLLDIDRDISDCFVKIS